MKRKIIVYGNSDKTSLGFPTAEDFILYIEKNVYLKEDGRYRFTQNKDADVIVLSREGILYGYFVISDKVPPTNHDRTEYPPVKAVYLVQSSSLYHNPVPMTPIGISGIQFGKYITEEKFAEIEAAAHGSRIFCPPALGN